MQDRLLREQPRVGEAQGIEQPLAHHLVPHLAGEDLHDPADDGVPRVAVGHRGAQLVGLFQLDARVHVALQTVVAAARVLEVIAVDAAGVTEEMAEGNAFGDGGIGNPEIREVGPNRRVQVDQSFVHELHEDGGGPHLALRADLEDRVGRGLDARVQIDHAGGDLDDLPIVEESERRSRHLVLGQELAQPRPQMLRVE
jgi:hypothetical protein